MTTNAMERSKLQALAKELAKDIKTEADLNAFSRELLKLTPLWSKIKGRNPVYSVS